MKSYHLGNISLPKSHRLIKTPMPGKRNFKMLVQEVQRLSKSIQSIAVVLGCLVDGKDKSLLLMIASTSDTGLKGTELGLTRTPPPPEVSSS